MTDPVEPGGLQPGLSDTSVYDVTVDMGPPHLDVAVLSTPWMLGLVEMTSLRAVRPRLAPHQTLVGTGARLTHDAAVRAGAQVTVTSTLVEVGRRLRFDAVVDGPEGQRIGTVELESAVVDTRRFARG